MDDKPADLSAALQAIMRELGVTADDIARAVTPVGRALAQPGIGHDMTGYPLLVYGPASDPKVRIARTGRPIAELLIEGANLSDTTVEEWDEAELFAANQGTDV